MTDHPTIPVWVPPLDTGQPNALDLNDLGRLPKANFAAGNQIIPITYGRDRLFGQPFVVHVDETAGYLYTAMSFCEGEIAGFEQVIIDSENALASGKAFQGVLNRNFENGDHTGWPADDGTVNNTVSYSGDWGMNIPAQLASTATQNSDRLLAPPEATVMKFRVKAARNALPTSLPDTTCRIIIREATTIGGSLSTSAAVTQITQGDDTVAGWQDLEIEYTVPAGVVEYTIGLRVDNNGTAVGSWDFDEVSAHIYDVEDVTKEVGIEVIPYIGSTTQVFDAMLAGTLSGYSDDLPGLAYVVMRCPADSTRGFPRLEAIVQGRKIYDPRKDDTAGALGPELTLTRSGTAWFRDWEGLYREVGANEPRFDGARRVTNLYTYSNDFSNAAWDKINSVVTQVTTPLGYDSKSNVWELRDNNDAGSGSVRVEYDHTFLANQTYCYSADVKQGSSNIPVVLFQLIGLTDTSNYIYFNMSTGVIESGGLSGTLDQISVEDKGDGWYRISITVLGDATDKSCTMSTFLAEAVSDTTITRDGTHYMYTRNQQWENVTGQGNITNPSEYVDTTTVAAARTFNTDRQGHVLVGSRVVENIVLESQTIDQSPWTSTRAARTSNAAVAPDGTLTADSIDEDSTAASTHFFGQGVAGVDDDEWLYSVYLKASNRSWARVGILNRTGGNAAIGYFDLANGVLGTASLGYGHRIEDVGNGWYRCSVAGSIGSGGTSEGVQVVVAEDDLDLTIDGLDQESLLVWGNQLERVGTRGYVVPYEYLQTVATSVSETYTTDLITGEDLPGGRGLMREEPRTNVVSGSCLFDDPATYWVINASPTITEVDGLFEGYSGYQHDDDGGANRSRSQIQGVWTDGETDVTSFIIENIDATETDFGLYDGTATAWVNFGRYTWATGALSTTSGSGNMWVEDMGIGPNGGAMVRLAIAGTGTAAGTGATGNTRRTYIYPSGSNANTNSTILYHGQLEEDVSFPTSPIVTPDATDVTRSAETVTATDMSWDTGLGGTLYASGIFADQGGIVEYPRFVSLNDNTNNERVGLGIRTFNGEPFMYARTGGVTEVDTDIPSNLDVMNIKAHLAMSFDGTDYRGSTNGSSVVSDATGSGMPVYDQLDIGSTWGGTTPTNGFVSEIRFYNVIQSDAWLVEASRGGIPDGNYNNDPSLTMGFNFGRDMTLQGLGTAGGYGAHRADDSTTWEFSQNPTIQFRDMIDNFTGWDILDAGVIDNANANDQLVDGVPRRQVGLSLARPNTVDSWVKGWRTYMGAFLNWEGGKIRVIPNRPDVEAPGGIVGDGVDGEVSMGDPAILDFIATDDFTVELKYKSVGSGLKVMMAKKDSIADASAGYSLHISDAVLQATIADGATAANDQIALAAHDNTWRHAAFTVDRTLDELEVYSEGVASGTPTDITSIGSLATTEKFNIMGDESGNFWDGVIDEVRVWSVKRTPAQILDNIGNEIESPESDATLVGYWKMNEATSATMAPDESGNGNDGTLAGGATFGTGDAQVIPDGVAMHIGVDDIVKDSLNLSRRSLRSVPNSVAIDYEDSSGTRWFTARTQADSVRVTNGDEVRRISRVSLPGIHNASQASREAVERLNWYLTDLECTLTLFDEGWNLTHGSIVAVTHPIGLDAKLFRVRQTTAHSGRWTLDLVEYDPTVYSDEVVADPTIPDTNLGNPLNPPTPTNLVLAEELFNYKTGTTGSRVRVTWDATQFPFLSQYLVEGYVAGAKVWQTTTAATNIVSPPVEEIVDTIGTPTSYEVRVFIQSPFATGPAVIGNVQIDGKFAIPSDVPNIYATQTGAGEVAVNWDNAVDIDIWRYELRQGTTSDTWATATTTDLMDDTDRVFVGLPLGTHRFFVKAIDSVRNESATAKFVDITLSAPVAVSGLFGFEVASEVRLNWAAVTGSFVERYRIAYSDIPETFETTLDIVDTLRFQTKDVPEGTFTFKAYSLDGSGNEATTAATIEIEVTSDADAFLADTYDFSFRPDTEPDIVANGSLTNMVQWNVRLDDIDYYVTNMADSFAVSPTDFVAADPLANYHSTGASEWLSETKDFGLLLTGSWNLTHDTTALQGNIDIVLELSTDDVTYVSFGGSAKGEYRYARVRISTLASPGTATTFTKNPVMSLKINVVPLEESGESVSSSSAGVGKTVNLEREYIALKEIMTQPKNTIASGSAVTSIVDNIVIGPNTAIQCNGTEYYAGGDWAELDFASGDFSVEYVTRHDGSAVGSAIMFGKRNGSLAGWTVRHNYNLNEIDFIIDDGTNQVACVTTGDALPNDGLPHHVMITVARGATDEVRIYVDDVLNGASPHNIATVTGSIDNAVNFNIFASNTGASIHAAGGQLDQIRIWSDVRTPAENTANWNKALDMTQTQTGLVHYQLCDGGVGDATGDITDVTTNARTLTATGAGDNTYIDPGSGGPNVLKINSFDVFIFDTFGQQLAEQFQWKWKAV